MSRVMFFSKAAKYEENKTIRKTRKHSKPSSKLIISAGPDSKTTDVEMAATVKTALIKPKKSSAKELKKTISVLHAFAYVVGLLLGSGVFISPGIVAKQTNNMGMALIVWTLSGMICTFGALCFCELACALKKTGGEYIFIKETYGDFAAFCVTWAQTLVTFPTGLAVMAVSVGEYCVSAFCDSSSFLGIWLVKAAAVGCLSVTLIINCVSTSFVGKTQVFVSAVQVIAVVFFIAMGIWKASTGFTENYTALFNEGKPIDIRGIGLAFFNSLWAFDGWGMICTITEEMQNPQRDLRIAVIIGIPFVTLCYVLINLAFMTVLSQEEIASSIIVATKFIEKSVNKKLALIVPVFDFLFGFSAINAILFITSRSLLSAAREGHLPEPISYIHRKRRTPIPAVVLNSLLPMIWILTIGSEIQSLITYFSFAVWLMYGLAIFAVIVLRIRRPDLPRPFKVWIANPIFMTLVSLYLVLSPFAKQPIESSISLACLLIAIPVYYLFIYDHKYKFDCLGRAKEKCYGYLMSVFNLVPCVHTTKESEADDSFEENNTLL